MSGMTPNKNNLIGVTITYPDGRVTSFKSEHVEVHPVNWFEAMEIAQYVIVKCEKNWELRSGERRGR